MLTLSDASTGIGRRGFLTLGALGLGGLSLPSLLAASSERPAPLTGKSVIFLFQQGGPSQFETFDPKPDAPRAIRTMTGTTQTSLPGVRFGDAMPRLARLADRLTVVRSFQTGNANHNIVPVVGPDTLQATIGALYSRVAGAIRPDNGMPTNAVLFPQAVSPDVKKGAARGDLSATGGLGRAYAPFVPGAGGQQQRDMRLLLSRERLDDRRHLLSAFDRLERRFEGAAGGLDRFHEQAYRLLFGRGVADALDLSRESSKVLARYDTGHFVRADGWSKARRGQRGYYTGHAASLGKLLLMARRLCEAGCGFVTVHAGYEGIWDLHADTENLNTIDGMEAVGRPFDHAVAAFVEDVEARGLSDRILLVCCGEMGRTPRINKNGGRDHWANLCTLALWGGGLKMGQVIGETDARAERARSGSITFQNVMTTIYHVLGIDPATTLNDFRGRPQYVLEEREPIAELDAPSPPRA
jgi:hypothetical protein